MNRLLLIPALVATLAFAGCGKKPEPQKSPEVTRVIPLDDFNHFPAPEPAPVAAPTPKPRPVVKHVRKTVKHTAKRVKHTPFPVEPVETEVIPEPVKVPCLFPFSIVPSCTAGNQ